jgi:alcohol dehydrogenase class IV
VRYAILEGGISRITDRTPPLVAIPTTAESGSEVGRAALLTLTDGRKLGFLSPYLLPRAAICDPELTLSMSPRLTAGTGMDALAHCVETFCRTRLNPVADAIALDGLERGYRHILTAFAEGVNLEARTQMLLAALEGGLAFQKSLGAVHKPRSSPGSSHRAQAASWGSECPLPSTRAAA